MTSEKVTVGFVFGCVCSASVAFEVTDSLYGGENVNVVIMMFLR